MAVRTFGEPIVEVSGIVVTTNTEVYGCQMPVGAEEVMFNGAAAHTFQICPRLDLCCKTTDNEVSFTNYTTQARDADSTTLVTLSSLDTAANGDYWYVGSRYKFAGVLFNVTAANGSASTMTGYYWNGSAWADASITDNSNVGGACIGATGWDNVVWATPATWARRGITGVTTEDLYIIRFQVSAALDSSTTLNTVLLKGDTTNSPAGYAAATTDYVISMNRGTCDGLSFTAGAASTVNVTWIRHTRRGLS